MKFGSKCKISTAILPAWYYLQHVRWCPNDFWQLFCELCHTPELFESAHLDWAGLRAFPEKEDRKSALESPLTSFALYHFNQSETASWRKKILCTYAFTARFPRHPVCFGQLSSGKNSSAGRHARFCQIEMLALDLELRHVPATVVDKYSDAFREKSSVSDRVWHNLFANMYFYCTYYVIFSSWNAISMDSNPKLMTMHHYAKFGCKSPSIYTRNIFLRIWACTVTLTFKTATQSFCMTLRVMLMHHHTKFCCIQFSGSQDVFWIKVWTRTVTLTFKTATQSFALHSGSWWCTTIPNLVAYNLVVHQTSSWQKCNTRTDRQTVNRTASHQGTKSNLAQIDYNTKHAHFTNVKHNYKHNPKVSPFGIALVKYGKSS